MFEKSVLLAKANKPTYEEIFATAVSTQMKAYQATLKELDDFLDAGDLPQVTLDIMNIIKADLLNIIDGFRRIREGKAAEAFSFVRSIDEILAKLRPAKLIIFNIEDYFQNGKLKADSKQLFYDKMEECRPYIEAARRAFLES